MIDSGASHNFIAPQVAATLDLEIDYKRKLAVRLANGHLVFTKGKYPRIPLQIGEISTTVGAYILELGEIDIILGIEWLQTLGKVTMNY